MSKCFIEVPVQTEFYILPRNFQQVESVTFSGDDYFYFTTSIGVNGATADIQLTSTGRYQIIVGAPDNSNTVLKVSDGQVPYMNYGGSSYGYNTGAGIETTRTTISSLAKGSNSYIKVNGAVKNTFTLSPPNWKTFRIGSWSNSYNEPLYAVVYHLALYNSENVPVCDFYPCYNKETCIGNKSDSDISVSANTVGFYDIINKKFYVPAGGSLGKGADTNKRLKF